MGERRVPELPSRRRSSLTHRKSACTLTKDRGSVIPECPYHPEIPPSKPHEPARACKQLQETDAPNRQPMPRKMSEKICVMLLALAACAGFAQAQAPIQRQRPKAAPATASTIDGSEAMFTTMCALYADGYEGDVSPDNWST